MKKIIFEKSISHADYCQNQDIIRLFNALTIGGGDTTWAVHWNVASLYRLPGLPYYPSGRAIAAQTIQHAAVWEIAAQVLGRSEGDLKVGARGWLQHTRLSG